MSSITDIHVLLVEDDIVDSLNIKYGFKKNNLENTLNIAENGAEALEYFDNISGEKNVTPKLIILDINMPKMNGFEFLRKLRHNPLYKSIPVVIVTTSNSQQDIEESKKFNNVVGYFVKPLNFEKFLDIYKNVVHS